MIHPRRRHEAGQATTAIIIIVALALMALGFAYTGRLAKAEDQGSRIQAAADAAALAGAQSIVTEVPGRIVSAMNSGKLLPSGLGQGAASEFAARNAASIISYTYNPASDRIEVRVRSNAVSERGQREVATATARIGLRIGVCKLPPPPKTPTPPPTTPPPPLPPGATPTPTPSPKPTTPPPTSFSGTATCGDLSMPVTLGIPSGKVTSLKISAAALKDRFTPALHA